MSLPSIAVGQIRQSTSGVFSDLFFRANCLVFVQQGEKRVRLRDAPALEGGPGDVFLFAGRALATVENRTWSGQDYVATVLAYPDDVVRAVFPAQPAPAPVQLVTGHSRVFASLKGVLAAAQSDLPPAVLEHRRLEPLHWLQAEGYALTPSPAGPAEQIRALIESNLTHPWRAEDGARHLAVSEATLRRQLSRTGQSFSKLLTTTRLEHGLVRLQTTSDNVSEIAMDCGFASPSHFSDTFKTRFGLSPRQIRSST